jgi:hypothetical protein
MIRLYTKKRAQSHQALSQPTAHAAPQATSSQSLCTLTFRGINILHAYATFDDGSGKKLRTILDASKRSSFRDAQIIVDNHRSRRLQPSIHSPDDAGQLSRSPIPVSKAQALT